MFPILIEWGGLKIYSYGFFIAVGYVAAMLLGRSLARSRQLNPAPFMDLAFLAITSGVLGARLLFVLQNLPLFLAHPGEIFNVWNGGLVFYGGFLLAAVVCLAYGRWQKMPIRLSTDIVVTGVAFAHAFGRVGCLAAGCCHGNACSYPWAVRNDTEFLDPTLHGQLIHPVQLYESFSLFLLTALLVWLIRGRKLADGQVALIYLTGYAAIRFVTEFFRGDLDRGHVPGSWLSTSQGIALALFLLGGALFVRGFRGIGRNH